MKLSIFQKFCLEIFTIFKVLDNPTKGPVHLEQFCSFASEVLDYINIFPFKRAERSVQ